MIAMMPLLTDKKNKISRKYVGTRARAYVLCIVVHCTFKQTEKLQRNKCTARTVYDKYTHTHTQQPPQRTFLYGIYCLTFCIAHDLASASNNIALVTHHKRRKKENQGKCSTLALADSVARIHWLWRCYCYRCCRRRSTRINVYLQLCIHCSSATKWTRKWSSASSTVYVWDENSARLPLFYSTAFTLFLVSHSNFE